MPTNYTPIPTGTAVANTASTFNSRLEELDTAIVDLQSGSAPVDAAYITQTPHADLTAEQALSLLATGILKNTTTTGVLSIAVGADLPAMTGDSGAGGAGGAVPAPAAGDAAAGKFLRADGTWANTMQFVQTASATAGNSTSELSLIGSGIGSATLAAGALNVVGKTLRIRGSGRAQRASSTVTLKVKLGATTLFNTGAIGPPFGVGADNPFTFSLDLTTRSIGATGTIMGQGGFVLFPTNITGSGTPLPALTSPATVDLTGALAVDITGQWGSAGADRTITMDTLTIEVLD